MYQVELKDGRILSMSAHDVKTFRPLIRAFMLARPATSSSAVDRSHALRRHARNLAHR